MDMSMLHDFIVRAKQATYVGNGEKLLSYRLGSVDLQYREGDWVYHDSYFGSQDFLGQEVVYERGKPIWGMNYFGRILLPEKITVRETVDMIRRSLSAMYAEGRFLGGFEHEYQQWKYVDHSVGEITAFTGKEWIEKQGERVYELQYHGGMIV